MHAPSPTFPEPPGLQAVRAPRTRAAASIQRSASWAKPEAHKARAATLEDHHLRQEGELVRELEVCRSRQPQVA
eukprot:1461673-Pyramimonas_sp.AAC.1